MSIYRTIGPLVSDPSKVVVLLWFSVVCFWCQSLGDVSPYVC